MYSTRSRWMSFAARCAAGDADRTAGRLTRMAKRIILNPVPPVVPTVDEIMAEIRGIYFRTNKSTILKDFDRAIDLLKMVPTPEERQRATVYMDGLAEMRREFNVSPSRGTSGRRGARARKRSDR